MLRQRHEQRPGCALVSWHIEQCQQCQYPPFLYGSSSQREYSQPSRILECGRCLESRHSGRGNGPGPADRSGERGQTEHARAGDRRRFCHSTEPLTGYRRFWKFRVEGVRGCGQGQTHFACCGPRGFVVLGHSGFGWRWIAGFDKTTLVFEGYEVQFPRGNVRFSVIRLDSCKTHSLLKVEVFNHQDPHAMLVNR